MYYFLYLILFGVIYYHVSFCSIYASFAYIIIGTFIALYYFNLLPFSTPHLSSSAWKDIYNNIPVYSAKQKKKWQLFQTEYPLYCLTHQAFREEN